MQAGARDNGPATDNTTVLLAQARRERDLYAAALYDSTKRYEQKIREFSLLRRSADALREWFDLEEVFRRFLTILREEVSSAACSLYLAEDTGEMVLRARCLRDGPIEVLLPGQVEICRIAPGDGPLGQGFLSGEVCVVEQVPPDAPGWFPEDGRTVVSAPLGPHGGCIGLLVLHAGSREDLPPDARELLPILASQATVAIENAALYRRLKQHSDTLEARVRERTAALEHVTEELKAVAEQKARFFAHFSHELRTPLNSILGFSEMLQAEVQGPLTEAQRRYVRFIHESGTRLLRLINDILDLAKVEAGKLSLNRRPVLIGPIVEQALEVMMPQARAKHLEVRAAVSPRLPSVLADPGRVHQILLNLLSNAIKFTPEGGRVVVWAEVAGESSERRTGGEFGAREIRISVCDSGIGISEEDKAKLFHDFGQVAEGRWQGTGLGLSLTRRLVALHGGQIGFVSARHQGSTFWFTLPISIGEDRAEATSA
jgi:signal transduction histidine kinase